MPTNVPSSYPAGKWWALLQSTQHNTWWVIFEQTHFVLSQSVHNVPRGYFVKDVPAGYFAGKMGGYFSKEPTIYLLGLGWANGWVLFESAHYLPTGYEPGKLFQNPQLTHNVPTGYIALCPQ